MSSRQPLRSVLLLGVFVASLVATGCATRPPTAEKMGVVPMGTITTYHRKSSGSLGAFDGPVVWTHTASTWQGRPMMAIGAPQAGISLHDEAANLALVAQLGADGQPQASFSPPVAYQWPLEVGKAWTSNHTVTMLPSGRTVQRKIDWRVESWGEVTVPAGSFKAFKLVWTNELGEVETRWVNPMEGLLTIKRHVERPASHPQGAGVLDAEMLSRVLPTR
jgi:hypothetical protein